MSSQFRTEIRPFVSSTGQMKVQRQLSGMCQRDESRDGLASCEAAAEPHATPPSDRPHVCRRGGPRCITKAPAAAAFASLGSPRAGTVLL